MQHRSQGISWSLYMPMTLYSWVSNYILRRETTGKSESFLSGGRAVYPGKPYSCSTVGVVRLTPRLTSGTPYHRSHAEHFDSMGIVMGGFLTIQELHPVKLFVCLSLNFPL